MKKILFLIILISLIDFSTALTVSTDKNIIEKGDTVLFFGTCEKEKPIFVKATNYSLIVFEANFECPDSGEWSIPQEISFLTPSGKMRVIFTQKEKMQTVFLDILPSRESSLFLIDFFNIPPQTANRLEWIVLDLKLLENNDPVEGAKVVFWDFDGSQKQMHEAGQGIYRGIIKIPVFAPLLDFNLFVVAEKISGSEKKGTEFSSKINVSKAPILLTIEKPQRLTFDIGKISEWKVKATYLDGAPLQKPEVFLLIDNTKTTLNQEGDFFSGSIVPIEENAKTKKATIIAKDEFGNTAELEKNIVFSTGLYFSLYNLFILTIISIVFVIGFWKVVLPKLKSTSTQVKSPFLEKEIREKIKKIQVQYYSEQSISRKEYQEKLNELQRKLDELKNL